MNKMGTITINVNDEIERQFRKAVKETKGTGKGKLGEAVTEAINKWAEEKRQKEIAAELKALIEKGFDMGKLKIKSRDELYDRH